MCIVYACMYTSMDIDGCLDVFLALEFMLCGLQFRVYEL